jgi:hypothetical protein
VLQWLRCVLLLGVLSGLLAFAGSLLLLLWRLFVL